MDYKIANALKIWSISSCEHIVTLQNFGTFLTVELTTLFAMFKDIDDALTFNELPANLDSLCEDFERANRAFVYLLENIKFDELLPLGLVQSIIGDQLRAKRYLDELYCLTV